MSHIKDTSRQKKLLQCVAVCCSVLQRVAACCSVLQRALKRALERAQDHVTICPYFAMRETERNRKRERERERKMI